MQAFKIRTVHLSCLMLLIFGLLSPVAIFAQQEVANSNLLALQATDNEQEVVADETAEEEESTIEEDPLVPTKIQWLILTGIAVLVGIVSYLFKAHQLTTDGELNIYPITKTFSIPLHKPIYKFMIFLTASMALVGFATCLSIYNSVYMPDIVGISIAGPIFAYLIHLLYLMEKGRKEV